MSSPLGSPEWFLDRLDFQKGQATFVRTSRQRLSGAPFLDHRWTERSAEQRVLPLARLLEFRTDAPAPAFLWHTAFCCSSLIASCLDAPGACLPLKEPAALVDLSSRESAGAPKAEQEMAWAIFTRLGLGFSPGERVLIKPGSAANSALLPDAVRAEAPMLLLYSSCRDFLLSVVGGGVERGGAESRRKFARDLLAGRAQSQYPPTRFGPEDLGALTDLQAAALLWHLQVAEFRAAARAAGPAQARSLDCELFLADPARTLGAIDDFLDLGLGDAHVRCAVNSGVLDRHALAPGKAFDATARRRGFQALEAEWGTRLDDVVAWSYDLCSETPKRDPVGAPLLALDA